MTSIPYDDVIFKSAEDSLGAYDVVRQPCCQPSTGVFGRVPDIHGLVRMTPETNVRLLPLYKSCSERPPAAISSQNTPCQSAPGAPEHTICVGYRRHMNEIEKPMSKVLSAKRQVVT